MIRAEEVCAVLVTRGDVDMAPIIETLPYGEVLVWNNGELGDRDPGLYVGMRGTSVLARRVLGDGVVQNRGLYGRYEGIFYTHRQIIYFQDDDCLVRNHDELMEAWEPGYVVGNFRRDKAREHYYSDTVLLGWGSLFPRNAPFSGWLKAGIESPWENPLVAEFTWPVLTPNRKVLVDIEPGGAVEWLREDGAEIFARENRMSNQPGFYDVIESALAHAREVRDA